ncbi:copper resistance system multicopper oxidase [Thermithiobacillus plumbiphilus]|uniref:Copper resistance system multicopper oxidase n=1 Tax=Thermithiobacillus plumbiphilus TaxID=1729899 RepID=A0ABU9D6E1_9PROT
MVTRRRFLQQAGALGLLAGLERFAPAYAWAQSTSPAVFQPRQPGNVFDLTLRQEAYPFDGRNGSAITINGSVPGPLLRFREGETVTLRVHNQLDVDSSIHWHGLLVPNRMDGVPNVVFPGIKAGETFIYQYPIRQSGTYWYHSHTRFQEQSGLYGPIIIDPSEPDPVQHDREYVVMLSDWTFEDPERVMAHLKKQGDYYNFQQRTLGTFFHDIGKDGWQATIKNRLQWGGMRMSPADILDVTGYTYTYLMNGLGPVSNWNALFRPGEKVRLRFINGSAQTFFDVRIPGLKLTVVQADGQNVQPVEVDEFRIGVAETYDVIVEPREDKAYTIFAESMDRSGYAGGTLAPRLGMSSEIPKRRPRPLRSMADMGMFDMQGMGSMPGMDMGQQTAAKPGGADQMSGMEPKGQGAKMQAGQQGMEAMPGMDSGSGGMAGMDMGSGDHAAKAAGGKASTQADPAQTLPGDPPVKHTRDDVGVANQVSPMETKNRLDEPGVGLGQDGWRVLVYTDLRSPKPYHDQRKPGRDIELHLTGNMERFIWSIDGKKYSQAEPIPFHYGERLRLIMVNDTMMEHPMHLHGVFMVLENGHGEYGPLKHTIIVKPAERLSLLITADEPGRWAFHCHMLYHMEAGMFRVVEISDKQEA